MADGVDEALQAAEQIANEARTLSNRVAAYSKRITTEGDTLAEEVATACKRVDKALAEATRHLGQDDSYVDVIKELESAKGILFGNGAGGDLRKFLRTRRPAILALLLGAHTNVVTVRKDLSLKLKEEYHTFRTRSAYIMFAISVTLHVGFYRAKLRAEAAEEFTLTPLVIVGIQFLLSWLLYFYTAAALRESVLRMNGSHIRPWWIHHHYWSIASTLVMLSLPVDSPAFIRAVQMFLWWAMLQALVIVMQNRYQRRRMYTRIAMGKNSPHDVISGESSGGHGQLALLYPMLFSLQGMQLYIGGDMVLGNYHAFLTPEGYLDPERKDSDLWGSRGVLLAGLMIVYMAIMNFQNTVATIIDKAASREKQIVRVNMMRARSVGRSKSLPPASPSSPPTQ